MFNFKLLVLFVHFCTIWAVIQAYCSESKIRECEAPIEKLHRELKKNNQTKNLRLYRKWNYTEIQHYCSTAQKVTKCLASLSGCGDPLSEIFKGDERAIDFVCKDSAKEYLKHQHCFEKPPVELGLFSCGYDSFYQFRHMDCEKHHFREKICKIVKDNFRCSRDCIESNCDKGAFEWELKFLKHLQGPLISRYHCDMHKDVPMIPINPNTDKPDDHHKGEFHVWAIIACLTMTMMFFLMLGMAIFCCTRSRERKEKPDLHFYNVLSEKQRL